MPYASSVNLGNLSVTRKSSAVALLKLAQSSTGPLRLQKKVENGKTVIHLGVRSWSTYFFEKIVATKMEIAKAELKTQVAIERDVRSFLHESGMQLGLENEAIVFLLHEKVLGKPILPAPASEDDANGDSSRRPKFRKSEFVQTTSNLSRGSGTVYTGLSVAVASPLRIIADVRLVTEETYGLKTVTDQRRGLTHSLGHFAKDEKKRNANFFKKHYLDRLNQVAAFVRTSAVLELEKDDGKSCSEANQEGARAAANEFTEMQKGYGKKVSIMLTVPVLPSKQSDKASTTKTIDTGSPLNRNDSSADGSDNEEMESED